MNENLIIIGAGGHGKVCLDIALEMNRWKDIYFLDDYCQEKEILGHKVLGTTNLIDKYKENYDFFVAIGDNEIRSKILNNLVDKNFNIATLIHPRAIISRFVTLGKGTVVMPGAIINSNTSLGKGIIINTKSSIDHDCDIEDYVHICPNVTIAGYTYVGSKSFVGMSVTIVNNIKIHPNITLGASSLVLKDLKNTGTYLGIPVKEEKK